MRWTELLDRIDAYDVRLFTLGGTAFTVTSAVKLVILIAALFWIAALVRRWTIERVLRHTHFDSGTRQAVGSIVRYLVLLAGLMLILQNAGLNLGALSVVAGAVGVGVGFGLQNIFSNFISGLIIMLERPIKVGDRVEVGGVEGTVRDIGARRTLIVTLDNVSILVPNQRFITDNVVNLVYAESPLRLRVPVAVAPGSDIERVKQALLDAAGSTQGVLQAPAPQVLLPSLGGGAMQFELTVWHEPRGATRQQLLSDLNFAIGERLRAAEIKNA
jgi:small-conductance mechanosensitive channel